MKVSIITSILDSHEIVRRQFLHYSKMNLPDDVEVIWMDDGSYFPIRYVCNSPSRIDITKNANFNLSVYETNEKRAWTEHIARNKGAKLSTGEYLFFADIDIVIPREAIEAALQFNGDRMRFVREFCILDENGDIIQDIKVLKKYGLKRDTVELGQHRSTYLMKREIFFKLGGYREDRVGTPMPQYVGRDFNNKWRALEHSGAALNSDIIPTVYMFPVGKYCGDRDYNPFGLFHNLRRR